MINNRPKIFSNSILVVAHPDDEILWFSSIVDKVDEILVCFSDYSPLPQLGEGRKNALKNYPLDNISSLEVCESRSFSGADWENPAETPYGMSIVHGRQIKQRYQDSYCLLEKVLEEKLRGYKNVFTHNPWGEYGHEDHVQIYRVIKKLQQQQSFNLWFSNYSSNRSAKLMFKYISGFDTEYISLHTNPELAQKIASIYKEHGCWTWYSDYRWFDEECFISDNRIDEADKSYGRIFPVNMLKTDFPVKPWKKPGRLSIFREKIQRKLKRKLRIFYSGI